MNHQWLAYAIVGVFSAGVAVAITGVPSSESVDATIVAPDTTNPQELVAVVTTVAEVVTTDPPETTAPPTTTAEAPASTSPLETTSTLSPLPERSDLAVVVANGADIGGLAGDTAELLEELGYVDVSATDGTEIALATVVYFFDGFEGSATRLAVDLGVAADAVAPIADAPQVAGSAVDDADLLVYLGADRG